MSEYTNLHFIEEPIYQHGTKYLRVGTDCSGIEAPIQALDQLGIPYRHVFSSDIDKYCIQSIKANYHPEILFGDPDGPYPNGDITQRDISLVPDIDLYVCGFPCQPFSQAGKRKGMNDKRGNVFWSCLKLIETKQPIYFILENVKGLLSNNNGNTWKIICSSLDNLSIYGYKVQWKIINTKDYGIPQNRERIYIVGTKNEFDWPSTSTMNNINLYIDNTDMSTNFCTTRRKKIIERLSNEHIFVDFSYSSSNTRSYKHAKKYCSCLGRSNTHWCIPKHRLMNCKEYLMLQGFNINFTRIVSSTQFKKQVGNSMSVNVIKKLIINLIR